jgi:hypothetical protein
VRVLDPACGSGNFLYVTLEHLKRLEAEVLELLAKLGEKQELIALPGHTVHPDQFLGLELNPRAAVLAELCLWIGYLQNHLRTRGSAAVADPVISKFHTIQNRDAVLACERTELVCDGTGKPVSRWDGVTFKAHPVTGEPVPDEAARTGAYRYVKPSRATWPDADFVVGNPPFIGASRMRAALGDGYTEALRALYPDVPESADFVMYWWHKAAVLARTGKIERFGFITTNSLRQTFNRRVLEEHLAPTATGKKANIDAQDGQDSPGGRRSSAAARAADATARIPPTKRPLSLLFAIPDHPWVENTDGAAVRIAMTVATRRKGRAPVAGLLQAVTSEHGPGGAGVPPASIESAATTPPASIESAATTPPASIESAATAPPAVSRGRATTAGETPAPPGEGEVTIVLASRVGEIHADLTIGADVAGAVALGANADLSCPGVKLHGAGFIVTRDEAAALGLGRVPGIEQHLREYRNGKDLTSRPRNAMVIDLFGLAEGEVRGNFPELYKWVFDRVKPERDQNKRENRKRNWWIFGEPNPKLRSQLAGLPRYIATVETAKHRFFQFLDASVLPDNKLICIAYDDAYVLGVLSSRIHVAWAVTAGSHPGVGNDPVYVKTRSFETFPFPAATEAQKARIRDLAERLDAHRKRQLARHPTLTMTDLYNVLEAVRAGEALTAKQRAIHEQGLVTVLRQLHDELDAAVADAYGWQGPEHRCTGCAGSEGGAQASGPAALSIANPESSIVNPLAVRLTPTPSSKGSSF